MQDFPSFLPQALSGRWTPFYAGGGLFFVNIRAAFPALDFQLIGKELHLGSAAGAFMQRNLEIATVLTRAMSDHSYLPYGTLLLSTFYLRGSQASMIWLIEGDFPVKGGPRGLN
jgi:hypothetical protein